MTTVEDIAYEEAYEEYLEYCRTWRPGMPDPVRPRRPRGRPRKISDEDREYAERVRAHRPGEPFPVKKRRRPGRPPSPSPMSKLQVFIDADVLARVDRVRGDMSRSECVRELVKIALDYPPARSL